MDLLRRRETGAGVRLSESRCGIRTDHFLTAS